MKKGPVGKENQNLCRLDEKEVKRSEEHTKEKREKETDPTNGGPSPASVIKLLQTWGGEGRM